jgi:predicted SAM-dependent methyltransferase
VRQAVYRNAGETDWGLPPFRPSDIWREAVHSLNGLKHHLFTQRIESAKLRRYARHAKGPVLLSVGSGRTVQPGWIGLDLRRGDRVFRCDLRKPIPLPDASVDGILAEHILEHFFLDDLPLMLVELRRVLKPGGPIRIVCPDATIVADLLSDRASRRAESQLTFDATIHRWTDAHLLPTRVANRLAYQYGQHKALLTGPITIDLLNAGGFCEAKEIAPLETVHFATRPGTHFDRFPDSVPEAFVVEALRPLE